MRQAGGRRRALGSALLLAVLVAASLAAVAPGAAGDHADPAAAGEVALVGVEGHDGQLWPYTSRARAFGTATLPVNLLVEADAETVALVLVADESDRWTVEHGGETREVRGAGGAWTATTGATRYSYVETVDGGRWVTETRQLHDGTYLGARLHVRLYQVGTGESAWTAVQAHGEHWDWFRLRHTVGSVADARYAVEHEFYGTGAVDTVHRVRVGNGGALDADGWVTVVDPVGGLLVAGALVARRRDAVAAFRSAVAAGTRHGPLAAALLAAPVGVRALAVAGETTLALAPKLVAAPGYLALAVGVPLVAARLGRHRRPGEAFAVAAATLGVGFCLDYALLGVTRLPLAVVGHRVALVVGVGLLAAGAPGRSRRSLAGAGVWVAALAWALVG
ncbi:hypothetical protein [Halorarius halobius]|uniref:hypothetical protein n=1 Tax=Halorarius halobius TaxID=2962671 RepID=UPI0020CE8555|nr:hypothetical protein [Halorarius halobius]